MVFSLLRLTSFLLLIVNGASMSLQQICAARCRYGMGGALCHCSLTHFSGKRSDSDVGTNPYQSPPPYSAGRAGDPKFAERETTLESEDSNYRLRDLAEVIDRLASQGQDDVSKQFGSDKRVDTASPPSSMDMSPRIPQILLEFNRMLKTRGAPVDRDNVVHHASQPAGEDRKLDSVDEKQGVYGRNLPSKSIDVEGIHSETDNQDMLRDKVAETVREIMESNHLQEDPFTANGHRRPTESDFYRDHKRSRTDTMSNARPGLRDATEDDAAGYNTNRKSKDGHLLKQIDILLRQVYRKGSTNLPSLEVFDNKVATS